MNIDLKFNKDFERALETLREKYGEDFEILNGIHNSQMNFSDFIDAFVDKNVADARLKAHNEMCPYDYSKAQKLYRDNVHRYYRDDKVIEIDTTHLSIEKCVELIVEKLKEVQKGEL